MTSVNIAGLNVDISAFSPFNQELFTWLGAARALVAGESNTGLLAEESAEYKRTHHGRFCLTAVSLASVWPFEAHTMIRPSS